MLPPGSSTWGLGHPWTLLRNERGLGDLRFLSNPQSQLRLSHVDHPYLREHLGKGNETNVGRPAFFERSFKRADSI
jgi:hypothetical protein